MSTVHEAEHVVSRRRVALKLVAPDAGLSEETVRRFMREARSAARLTHPNVVTVLDMGCDDAGRPYVVQELLIGEDLKRHLTREGRLSLPDAIAVFEPILDALALAHDNGIIHRDVKPANVFLAQAPTGEITPKLVDFGVVKTRAGESIGNLTQAGAIIGTPQYMAPEQLDETIDLDGRADVWAAGVSLFEVLTGRPPVTGRSFMELMHAVLFLPMPRASDLVPELSPEVDAVLAKALARDRDERYEDMRAFAAALATLSRSSSVPRRPSAWDVTQRPPPPSASPSSDTPPPPLLVPAERDALRHIQPARVATVRPTRRWRVGIVAPTRELETYPLAQALTHTLGFRCDVLRFLSYGELVAAMSEDALELGWLPPVAFIRARTVRAARLVVGIERSGQSGYASALVGGRAASTLSAIAGARAAWVDGWSAAGYLVPRMVLRSRGFDPDALFASQGFLGSYAAVYSALTSGSADVGAFYCAVSPEGKLLRKGWRSSEGLSVLAVSDPIPGDTLSAARRVRPEEVLALRQLLLDPVRAAPLLATLEATRFVESSPANYLALARALA